MTTSFEKSRADVLDRQMAYVDVGTGSPIVFLHGNPTSSYLWRNVWPHCQELGRCLAPDLIGMGDSDKLPDSGPDRYTFIEHRRYLDAWFDRLGVTSEVTLVIHDWGSALGFDWARRHPDAIKGIAYMEAIVAPVTWDAWPAAATDIFRAFRSAEGEKLVLEDNTFVEAVLPGAILRQLSDDEMAEYRRPFAEPGEPADVTEIVMAYRDWLASTPVPKLFVNGDPGAILTGPQRDLCRTFPNQQEVTVRGVHFLQEDSPDEIGSAIVDWYRHL
jgi:haloalkane dehalogenase